MQYELDSGRVINIPDEDVRKLQDKLGISQNEAIYTWLVDEDFISDATVEELSEKAKKNRITATIHQAKGGNNEKKLRKPREKKENPVKKQIIDALFAGLAQNLPASAEISITNDEKYIDICLNSQNFTVNLVQHREKKQK